MIITITVYQKSIAVEEKMGYTMRQCDASCLIDGELCQYIYKKDSFNVNKLWREQASSHAHYDAKNRGSFVKWIPVNKTSKTSKSKKNGKQLSLFGGE